MATVAAIGAAAVLAVAACSGTAGTPTVSGTPSVPGLGTVPGSSAAPAGGVTESRERPTGTADTTVPTPDASPDSADQPGTDGPGMTGDSLDVASSVIPATFDARTTAWFVAMCTSLGSVSSVSVPTYPVVTDGGPEPSMEQTRTKALADYADLRSGFSAAADSLDGVPAPTLGGGSQMAADVLASLRAMAGVAADAPATLGAAQTPAELQSAMDELRDRMSEASSLVPDDSPLVSDEVTAAMEQLPECRPLVGG